MAEEKVFISSVSKGMEPYRSAVRESIEGLDGYHALDMEHFGARDAPSYAACEAKVRSARCS